MEKCYSTRGRCRALLILCVLDSGSSGPGAPFLESPGSITDPKRDSKIKIQTYQMNFFLFNFQDEAFALWEHQWGRIYPEKSREREIIHTIHDAYYLINLVDNDYVAGNKLFDILDIVLKKLGKL